MTAAIDITKEQRKIIIELLRRFLPDAEVWAYGSRVKWTARTNSDLDLVAFASAEEHRNVSDLKDALSESDLPFLVDLHVWDDVPEKFRRNIEKEHIVFQNAGKNRGTEGLAMEWQDRSLGDIYEFGSGISKPRSAFGSGHPFLTFKDVFYNVFVPDRMGDLVNSTEKERAACSIRRGDVFLTRTSETMHELGMSCVALKDYESATFNGFTKRLRPKEGVGIAPEYAAYFFRSPHFRAEVTAMSSLSTRASLNNEMLSRLRIAFPDEPTQKAIGGILKAFDDKIELNRRMSETLETMARALFKSWFVDFDPVQAKTEGHATDLPKGVADLFPARFVDSELGLIPKGWQVGSVYDTAKVIYGAPFASTQFNTDGFGEPLIRIRDLATEAPGVWTPEIHPKGYRVRHGDIVVGMDGEFRAYLWGGPVAWVNQRICVFRPNPGWSAAFVRNSIMEPLARIEATETATTVIHLGKYDIDQFRVVLPDENVLNTFNQTAQPWYDLIVTGKTQSRALAALRDTLLPKLISGEVRVKDVERIVGGAT